MGSLRFVPIYETADIELAMLGDVEVGRVMMRDKRTGRGAWISVLPNQRGRQHLDWKPAKDPAQARAALQAYVAEWLRVAGLAPSDEPGQARFPDVRAEDAGPVVPPATGSSARRGQVDLRQPLPAPPDFPDATGQQEG